VTTLDSYMFRKIARPLALVFIAFVGIFILVDLFDHANKFIDNKVGPGIVFLYYLYYMPWIVVLTAPVAMLLASLLAIGRLSRSNEIMAMKGGGVSLYRILAPVLLLAVGLSLASLFIGEVAMPPATRRRLEIKETHLSRRADRAVRTDVIYIRPDGVMLLARRFNVGKKRLDQVTVEEFDDESNPTMRIDAERGRWEDGHWVLENGRIRRFTPDGEEATSFEKYRLPYTEPSPDDLRTRRLEPEEMGYAELRGYIKKLRASGNNPRDLDVQLQLKISFPFVTLIMTLIGAPLAAATRRTGFAISFTAALAVSFIYFGLIQVGDVLGSQGFLPPVLGAWAGNIVFAGIGVWLLIKAPK
jgi:lipopolysaccharide export system permease protein